MSAVPPAAAPVKVPTKIVVKMPGVLPAGIKLPMVAPKIPMAAPRVAVPAPVAAPKVVVKPAPMDDDDLLLAAAPKAVVKAPVPAKPKAPAAAKPVAQKRPRTPSPSSSSSDSSSDADEEEGMTLFGFAKKNDLLVEAFKDEDLEAPVELGNPVQPIRQKVSTDIDADIRKLIANMGKTETDMQIKEDTKTVSLGTSKTNYIDPRIVYAFAKRMNVETKKLLSGTLNDKFQWAHATDGDYAF